MSTSPATIHRQELLPADLTEHFPGALRSHPWVALQGEAQRVDLPMHAPVPMAPSTRKPVCVVKDGGGLVRFHPEEIQHIQADGNYVEVYLPSSRVVLRNSLAEVLRMLPAGVMAQINRGQAINLLRLEHVGCDEVLVAGRAYTLSRCFREGLLGRLKIISDR